MKSFEIDGEEFGNDLISNLKIKRTLYSANVSINLSYIFSRQLEYLSEISKFVINRSFTYLDYRFIVYIPLLMIGCLIYLCEEDEI